MSKLSREKITPILYDYRLLFGNMETVLVAVFMNCINKNDKSPIQSGPGLKGVNIALRCCSYSAGALPGLTMMGSPGFASPP